VLNRQRLPSYLVLYGTFRALFYRGADNSLARPGRKKATATKL